MRSDPYRKAGKWVMKPHRGKGDIFLVHGTVWNSRTRRHQPHAWVEFALQFKASRLMITKDKGKRHVKTAISMVRDRVLPKKMRLMTKDSYYEMMRAKPIKKYGKDEAAKMLASRRNWGPWHNGIVDGGAL